VADFAIEFHSFSAKNGWNTEAVATAFHQGFSNSINDELDPWELGEDLESLITLEIKIDSENT
jgi:hypothetical protein